jgi:predicted PurR-regulated permease PerM
LAALERSLTRAPLDPAARCRLSDGGGLSAAVRAFRLRFDFHSGRALDMPKEPSSSPQGLSEAAYVRRVLIFVGIAALAAGLYVLSDILLLIFGSVLFAVVLRAIARPIRKGTSMSERLALLAAGLGVVAVLGVTGYLFGSRISAQLATVMESLPAAAERFSKTVLFSSVSEWVKGSSIGELVMNAFSWGTTLFGAVATLVVVIVAGIYIAIAPHTYRNGLVMLFPRRYKEQVAATLDDAGEALRRWLGGQLLAMIMVGILIAVGLALVGVPSALALGLIAGVTEFVPILGPVIGAIPALLLASTQGWNMVAWTLVVFVVVQQIESNLIMPLVAGRAVAVPPAVGLFAVVAIGVLFGPLGLLLGYPLAIVIDVAVRRLYVREALGEEVEIAGEEKRGDAD